MLQRLIALFFVGLVGGGLSWMLSEFASGSFEPFDGGLYVQQAFLGLLLFFLLYEMPSLSNLFVTTAAIYAGQIAYSCFFGGEESGAWVMLGAVTIIALCIFPFISGAIGFLVGRRRARA